MSERMTSKRLDEIKNTLFPDNVQPLADELILEVDYLLKRIRVLRERVWKIRVGMDKIFDEHPANKRS